MSDPPLAPPPPPAPPPPLPSSSLLTRLTTRLAPRNRAVAEFAVEPDNPWKTHAPGERVLGAVVLTVVRPLRVTHLTVRLEGIVRVFKNAIAPSDGVAGRGGSGGGGFAPLFEDEVPLCGDGRLKEGVYKFRFELRFPPCALPTSIAFERGAIAYHIVATLTRPTTIAPVMTCDRRIALTEPIDIAPLRPLRRQTVTLDPVLKRRTRSTRTTTTTLDMPEQRPPLSPVPSERSCSSCVSNSTVSLQASFEDAEHSTRNSSTNTSNAGGGSGSAGGGVGSSGSGGHSPIGATVELARPGGLPGDSLPVSISIRHNKPIRSHTAIIVTLYRQARIDLYPPSSSSSAASIASSARSKPSLASLSSLPFVPTSRSSGVFRKDLAQMFAPMFVDPTTLTAAVRTAVRIPADAFPTITGVPGGMISFRYYVEVVIDLRGKLNRYLPRADFNTVTGASSSSSYMYGAGSSGSGGADAGSASGNGDTLSLQADGRAPVTSGYAGNLLDTTQVRREKGVVTTVFPVVVGSRDSARTYDRTGAGAGTSAGHAAAAGGRGGPTGAATVTAADLPLAAGPAPNDSYYYYQDDGEPPQPSSAVDASLPLTPPDLPPEPPVEPEPVDEKERLARAEALLLPSAPPGAGSSADVGASVGGGSGRGDARMVEDGLVTPTAPVLVDDDGGLGLEVGSLGRPASSSGSGSRPRSRPSSRSAGGVPLGAYTGVPYHPNVDFSLTPAPVSASPSAPPAAAAAPTLPHFLHPSSAAGATYTFLSPFPPNSVPASASTYTTEPSPPFCSSPPTPTPPSLSSSSLPFPVTVPSRPWSSSSQTPPPPLLPPSSAGAPFADADDKQELERRRLAEAVSAPAPAPVDGLGAAEADDVGADKGMEAEVDADAATRSRARERARPQPQLQPVNAWVPMDSHVARHADTDNAGDGGGEAAVPTAPPSWEVDSGLGLMTGRAQEMDDIAGVGVNDGDSEGEEEESLPQYRR